MAYARITGTFANPHSGRFMHITPRLILWACIAPLVVYLIIQAFGGK